VSFKSDEYGKRALDFVQGIQGLTAYEDICRHIMKELEWYGFKHLTSFSIPRAGEWPAPGFVDTRLS
jgi:hypothetical protein